MRDGITLDRRFHRAVNAEMKVGAHRGNDHGLRAEPADRHAERDAEEVAHQRVHQRAAHRPQFPEPQRARSRRADSARLARTSAGSNGERYQTLTDARQPRRPDAARHERHAVQQHEQHGRRLQHHARHQHRHRPGDDRHDERAVGRIAVERRAEQHDSERRRQHVQRPTSSATSPTAACRATTSTDDLRSQGPDPRQQRRRSCGISTRRWADRSSRTSCGSTAASGHPARRTTSPACSRTSAQRSAVPARTRPGAPSAASAVPCPDQDVDRPAVGGDTWTRGETLNLTWQATQKNKVTFLRPLQPAARRLQQLRATTSPEAGLYFTHRPEYIAAEHWTNPYTNKLLFEGGLHVLQRALDLWSAAGRVERLWTRRGGLEDRVVTGVTYGRRTTCSSPPTTISTTCAPR